MRHMALALIVVAGCKQESAPKRERAPVDKAPQPGQKADDVPEVETIEVVPGIAMLVGAGGNIAVVSAPAGALIIDDQMPPVADKVVSAVARLGGKVRLVVNTHWHGDHTGNNERMAGEGAVIVAHENVRKRMSTEQFQKAFDRKSPPSPEAALPVVTFADDVTLHWGGQELHAFHVAPAHTDGDSIIHFVKANVIHTGDTYVNGGYPFIDLSSGGNVDGLVAAADRVLELADDKTRIIPGHGPLSDRAGLKKYRDMVATARDRVRALVRQGKTVEQIVAAAPTREWDDTLGKGFVSPEMLIGFLFEDAKQTR